MAKKIPLGGGLNEAGIGMVHCHILTFLHAALIHAVNCYKLYAMCKDILFPVDEVIRENGGVGPLAEKLGYKYQRVFNWKARGVPALEVALRPDIFAAATRGAQEHIKEAA